MKRIQEREIKVSGKRKWFHEECIAKQKDAKGNEFQTSNNSNLRSQNVVLILLYCIDETLYRSYPSATDMQKKYRTIMATRTIKTGSELQNACLPLFPFKKDNFASKSEVANSNRIVTWEDKIMAWHTPKTKIL